MKEVKEVLALLKRAVGLLECASLDAAPAGIIASPDYKPNPMKVLSEKDFNPAVAVQQDLFSASQFEAGRKAVERKAAAERAKAHAKASVRKRGTPGIGKSQALKNFREIAGDQQLLALAEVNKIFGYNESTSGNFVKDAIKSGHISKVPWGQKFKLLARSVKAYISEYYKGVVVA